MTESPADLPLPLAGRHALVTGAGSGIGAAIAQALARQGATLTLLGRRADALEGVRRHLPAAGGAAHGVAVADVTDAPALQRALDAAAQERGAVTILVNNAGAARSAPLRDSDDALWEAMIGVNLTGPFRVTRAVLPGMLAAGWGRIINIASTAGLRGYAYVAPYCAAKHGLIGLTRALALEVAQRGITVNALCPGYTDTPLLDGAVDQISAKTGRSAGQARASLAASNPQGRLVQPDEVAHTAVWLCLPGTESVHGQSIALAGGEVM